LLVSGGLKIDLATRQTTVNGFALTLTATEEVLFYILARHAGRFVPRQRLLRAIWGTDATSKNAELHVYIAQLRRKLEEQGGYDLIRENGSVGYSLALATDHERTETKTVL
jgi:two-component system KDP operon response regulator KdpE